MAVKTFKKKKGEDWFDVAARKFGDRNIGFDLIRKFGKGNTGVQYKFNTKGATGRVGYQMAATQGYNPFGLEGTDLPSDFALTDAFLKKFPQFSGLSTGAGGETTTSGLAGTTVPGALDAPTAIDDRPGDVGKIARQAEEGIRSFLQQQEFASFLSPQEQAGHPLLDGRPTSQGTPTALTEQLDMRGRGFNRAPENLDEWTQDRKDAEARDAGIPGELYRFMSDVGLTIPASEQAANWPGPADYLPEVSAEQADLELGQQLVDTRPSRGRASDRGKTAMDLPTNHPAGLNFGEVIALADVYLEQLGQGDYVPAIADSTARIMFENDPLYAELMKDLDYVFNEETGLWESITPPPGGTSGGAGTGSSATTGIGGGYYGRGGGGGGSGGGRRGSGSYVPGGSNLFNWRVNFG